jgi:hypothetical protein
MTYLAKDSDDDMRDPDYCLAKQAEYAAKAEATNDRALKSAYESAAREYRFRFLHSGSKRPL